MEHTDIPAGEIHLPFQWLPANEAARLAIAPLAGDIHKLALQLDDNTQWLLIDDSPATWEQQGLGAVESVNGRDGAVILTSADVGLSNVDNTSDASKPVSTAQAASIATKEPAISTGTTAQFWRGDKAWTDFATTVRTSVLTGLSTATNAAVTATDTVLAAIGLLQAQINSILALIPQSGDFKFVMRTTAPTGWVAGDGGTIGNVGSGATRAGSDTYDLFTAWWTEYSDAQLPILTSAGASSTRGASAFADWTALKRLTVFDVRGRFVRAADGSSNINGTKEADAMQGHIHVAAGNVNGSATGSLYNALVLTDVSSTESLASRMSISVPTDDGTNGTPRTAAETRPINIAMLGCFKL